MTNNKNDKTDPAPESTWGKTETHKRQWDKQHGEAARKAAANTADKTDKEERKP